MNLKAAEEFEACRGAIEGLAYRMLGSRPDAEDVAQETWLRWSRTPRPTVANPKAWLLKTASRIALDRRKSARATREHYVGPWLPDPWLIEDRSPAEDLAADESVTVAMMLAMERLSPGERAAFLLHDVFDFSFVEIAEVVNKSAASCRQLATRARRSLRAERRRYVLDELVHRRLLEAFIRACEEGDMEGLKGLLAADVVVISDSGGKALSARKILRTSDIAARLFIGIFRKARRRDQALETATIRFNGLPGAAILEDGTIRSAIGIAIREGQVAQIFLHRNPEKLEGFAKGG